MKTLFTAVCLIQSLLLTGQIVNTSGLMQIDLKDKTKVWVMPGYDASSINTYYYLPVSLRLSQRDGTPELSFTTIRENENSPVSGAILHFLLVWGLNNAQEHELEEILRTSLDTNAVLAGVASLEAPQSQPSFEILGKSAFANILRTKCSITPVAPLFPGTKMAFSYRLNAGETQIAEDAMNSASALDSIDFTLKYMLRGGHKTLWYNTFKEETFTLSARLGTLLMPVIQQQKRTK